MKLKVVNAGAGAAEVEVADAAFAREFNETLVHQVVVAYMAAGRAGTKAQKSRAEVRGGGRKPHAQKGTGGARAGSIRSPIWVGGGRAFAARPRDYSQKVNRKMYRGAIRAMFSELARTGALVVVPAMELDAPKTKLLAGHLKGLGAENALIIVEAFDEKLFLAARNLPYVEVVTVAQIDPVSTRSSSSRLVTFLTLRL